MLPAARRNKHDAQCGGIFSGLLHLLHMKQSAL
jgi:hypothetical protein